jgi:cytoplasmic iron level regulating protein YaaA (DUF328/UPF0246 family)
MITLLSPAKTLDFTCPIPSINLTEPVFEAKANQLAMALSKLEVNKLEKLLEISKKLALLNFDRFQQWGTQASMDGRRPAVLAYSGDVYEGLQAKTMSVDELQFAQLHLRILSGLYGILRPLDLIQPYRLEMGTNFVYGKAKDLYAFWRNHITAQIHEELQKQQQKTIINLASLEYSKSVDFKKLNVKVITPEFKDMKDRSYKMISFFAKRARGLMASWIIRNKIDDPEALVSFSSEGYAFNARLSTELKPVFTRG